MICLAAVSGWSAAAMRSPVSRHRNQPAWAPCAVAKDVLRAQGDRLRVQHPEQRYVGRRDDLGGSASVIQDVRECQQLLAPLFQVYLASLSGPAPARTY